jgi:hypothetical protein
MSPSLKIDPKKKKKRRRGSGIRSGSIRHFWTFRAPIKGEILEINLMITTNDKGKCSVWDR